MNKIRFFISLFLLPLLFVFIYGFVLFFLDFAKNTNIQTAPFWIGIVVYILFQIIFFKPMTTYVFGHELTHAITGLLSGARIKKFSVSKTRGSVTLTKDNIFITLSPYFIPIYSLFISSLYLILGYFIDIKQFETFYLFISGIALAFHYALTFYALKIGQEDIKIYGTFFSLILIVFINIVIFVLMLALIFQNNINVGNFFSYMLENGINIYKYIFAGVYKCLVFPMMK